ncbi:MAG: DUF881 domain-containing protein [Actinomycetota bacterium]|nr:DUF881 domain-containing protein [Actinomycetota bacterium]
MKINIREEKAKLSLIVGFFLLGLLISTSFYSQEAFKRGLPDYRKQTLLDSIKELEKEKEVFKANIINLRDKVETYEREAAATGGSLATFSKESEDLKEAAGLTLVSGSGLEITLADSPSFPEYENPNNYIIHDYDLRTAVNALLKGNPKGIAINDERLVATSSIRCAGSTIMVNSTRISTPYTIFAVGDPQRLKESLELDLAFSQLSKDYAESFGLLVNVKRRAKITLPAYKGRLLLEHAKTKGES